MVPLGLAIALWRENRGLTQAELARKAGMSRPNLSTIEQGGRDLTVGTLRRLAEALRVSSGKLVDGLPPQENSPKTLSRKSLDRIARWIVAAKGPRPQLSEDEKKAALWIRSVAKRQLDFSSGSRRSLAKTSREEGENLLKAKIYLGTEEVKNLLSRIHKLSQGLA